MERFCPGPLPVGRRGVLAFRPSNEIRGEGDRGRDPSVSELDYIWANR